MPFYYSTNKKKLARRATIISTYCSIFKQKSLPLHKQYWTMCATCVGADKQPLPGSELHQMLQVGLITPNQFHGVDREENIYAANCTYTASHWYCDDFYRILSLAADKDNFNPGIVNVDALHEPKRGIVLFCNILERLRFVTDVLFIGNFILKNRGHVFTVEDVAAQIMENPRFREVAPTLQWRRNPRTFYQYNGTAKNNRTEMCTVLMWRKSKTKGDQRHDKSK